jgi:hypothetical protein
MTVQAPLIYACKLVYLAGSDDAKLMQLASVSLSAPSAFGLAQFDNYGLPADSSHYVQQNAQNGKKLHLITPLDVGVPDVYPMPTWSERIRPTDQGGAVFQGMPMEKAIMAVTTVAIVYLLALMAGVIIWRNHPVMKAATPPLCVLVILGGAVCIASNYGTSLYALPSGCAASAWLLTCGATLCYGSIVLKTHRIYRIFNSAKLSVVKISNRDLYVMIAVALGVDVVLNSIWSGVGFDTEYITIDPYRPSRDYVECAYDSRALVLVFIQLAYKLMLLVACLVLTILTRSVPSAFNEALLLGGATYNSFVLLAFVLPLVAAQVGSREVTHAIRSFGILVIITSTVSILFLPKFCTIARPDSTRVLSLRKAAAHTPALGVTDPYAVDEPAGQAESHAAMKGRSPQQQQRGRMSAAGDDALSQGEDGMRPFSGHSHLQQSIPFGSMAIPSQASLPLSSQPGIVAPFPSVMLAAHSLPPPGAPGGGVVGAPHSASTDSATMLRKMESADGGASSTDDSPLQQHLQRIHQENVLLRRRIAQLESTSQTQATTNSSGSHTSFNINVPGSAYSSN